MNVFASTITVPVFCLSSLRWVPVALSWVFCLFEYFSSPLKLAYCGFSSDAMRGGSEVAVVTLSFALQRRPCFSRPLSVPVMPGRGASRCAGRPRPTSPRHTSSLAASERRCPVQGPWLVPPSEHPSEPTQRMANTGRPPRRVCLSGRGFWVEYRWQPAGGLIACEKASRLPLCAAS